MNLTKLTPVLVVNSIEPCLPFWERLGFTKTVEVPQGRALAFVILVKGNIEVMYQTLASTAEDVPGLWKAPTSSCIYLDVDSIDGVIPQLEGAPVVVARRKTPYGADEIWVREPGGNVVGFAAHA